MLSGRSKFWLCLLAFPAIVFAGDFDLPELPEAKNAPAKDTQITPEPAKAFKPIAEPAAKPAPAGDAKDATKDAPKDASKDATKDAPKDAPEQSDYDGPVNFAPIEATNVSDAHSAGANLPAGIVAKKIPANLNRPLQVGVFTGVKELLWKSHDATYKFTAEGNKVIASGPGNPQPESKYQINTDGACIALAPSQKDLATSCYPGSFTLTAKGGLLTAVNTVDVEEYLRGVVPYEIGKLDSSRFSALESQAIAARTYAYKHFGSRESMGFDVYADTKDQVYKGLSSATPLTDSAVKATAGIVMTYNGEFIIAYYHSTCGGMSETLATWGRPDLPYLKSKPDLRPDGTPWCNESSYSKWERNFSEKELPALFKKNGKEANAKVPEFKHVKAIGVKDTLASGRILTLEVTTDKGKFTVAGDKVRWLFKKNGAILPSSFFRVKHHKQEWKIEGKGFGHGVGMCQMGVRARSAAGQDFATILTHYYPGITLERFEK